MSRSCVTPLLLIGALMGGGCNSDDTTYTNYDAALSTNANEALAIANSFRADEELGRGGGPPTRSSAYIEARNRVAEARCDRMAACGAVGSGGFYASYGACLDAEKSRVEGWWGEECPNASLDAINACIEDVAADFCPATLDRVFVPAAGACAAPHVCGSR